ncbi:MAG TPA: hypothetical protein DDX14_06050, partial [Cyanobacteria bacterium UBA9579]|nr:hypothetical protein [Cyanobacteria bacterium UBA9579]
GKVNSMSDISRGYFLGIGEDSRELVKMLLSLGILIEIAEKASDATGITAIENIANTIASSTDSIASASSNYLHWKNELGDQAAKDNFKQAITNILTFSLPTSLFRLSPKDSSIKHLLFRNLSAVDAYSGTVETLSDYSKKLKELMQKEIKNPPAEIKDDPDKLAKWKMNETWKAFTAHSLNRGQVIGLLASQPYALMVNPLMQLGGPSRAILIALAGTLECWVSSFYLLLDNSNWHKFSNQLKKDMVENNNINITPEEFIKLRKSALSKAVESSTGQAGLSAVVKASKHIPADTSAKVKKAYNSIANVVDKTVARHVSTLLMKYLDKKYNKMSEEERENLDHGHHH